MTSDGFEIVLDTETTGLNHAQGDRLVEIACIELHYRRPTGRIFQQYINPERDIHHEAQAVHGLDAAFLSQFPCFQKIVSGFLEFIGSTSLVIHNAAFDLNFINYELTRCGYPHLTQTVDCGVVDTWRLAQAKYRGSPASLDALCRRFKIPSREIHGALIDAEILARVYAALLADVPIPSLYDDASSGTSFEFLAHSHLALSNSQSTAVSSTPLITTSIYTVLPSSHELTYHQQDVVDGIAHSIWKASFTPNEMPKI